MKRAWMFVALGTLGACGGVDLDNGASVYATSCATCHGADGTAGVDGAADLTVAIPAIADDAGIETTILNGTGDMDPVNVSESDMGDLLAYLRDTFPG